MANLLKSKRFVVRQSLIGKDTNVEVSPVRANMNKVRMFIDSAPANGK